ncbi:hypothetical protein [Blastopirellula marina]|uniref:Uncharacterized protein n=1 Tax=Blastopirellula marina TaxID=124 RepID=A0A2S8FCV4_9BACT|nr:hypothetical protein [Blastopirellula marina]PQO29979.1 hypothetical protein C5Y98_22215 [Blastopirellula marina]PTL42447.1 hypothetical protein C5Y97_22225 [Blastopirellula marina]
MMKSVWTAVFSVGVSSCFAMAEEPLRWSPNHANKVIDLYNEYMDSADWHMAELIALGAREKFGDDEPIIQRMLVEVEKAKTGGKNVPATDKTEKPKKVNRLYQKVYSLQDLVVTRAEGLSAGLDNVVAELEAAIGEETMTQTNSSMAPFHTNLSVVVSTTQTIHDQIAAHLKQMRAQLESDPTVVK